MSRLCELCKHEKAIPSPPLASSAIYPLESTGLRYAILNILGDVELVDACAQELNRLSDTELISFYTRSEKHPHCAHACQRKWQTLYRLT